MILTPAEIEACYADGRGMEDFARRIERAVMAKVLAEISAGRADRLAETFEGR